MTLYQKNDYTTAFLKKYHLFEQDEIQQVQLQHRMDLVKAFGIKEGMQVLEIGCGQGDTTAALADAVGENGHVIAIDIADPDYGEPLTLGQATDRIKQSQLGERIDFHFDTDFNTFKIAEPFDVAVLSHSSWYFKQPEDLLRYFKKLRQVSKKVCFAEWDLDFTSTTQRSHFCSASILALYSSFVNNDGNIQNLFSKTQIKQFLEQAGFSVEKLVTIDATYLQDGQWETGYANSLRPEFKEAPVMIQTFITSYYELMNQTDKFQESLNSFVICAK